MAEYIPKLVDRNFQNWIRGNLALNITKEGVADIVSDKIDTFHQDIVNDVLSTEPASKPCSDCSLENIFHCQTKHICIVKQGICQSHSPSEKQYRPCQNSFCDRMRRKIESNHVYHLPSWKNTSVESWYEKPWAVAKCYLPPDGGYITVNSIRETDINGILSIILNHRAFTGIFEVDSCKEARDVGRKIRHTSDYCMDDKTLHKYIDSLCKFLDSCSSSHHRVKAMEASQNLNKLKNEELMISTHDVTKILQGVIRQTTETSLKEVNNSVTESLQQIQDSMERCEIKTSVHLADILTAKQTALVGIEDCKASSVDDIKTTGQTALAGIEECRASSIDDIKTTEQTALASIEECRVSSIDDIKTREQTALASIEECRASSIDDIKTIKLDTVAEIKEVSDSVIRGIHAKITRAPSTLNQMNLEYENLKQNVQEDLITFYEEEHSTIPLTPMLHENEVDLLDFYVPPDFEISDNTAELRRRFESKRKLTSFTEIFMHGDNICRNIFITAEAGQGKSTFSKRLCLLWCYAKSGRDTEQTNVSEEEIQVMNKFELVFLIPLRFVRANECDLDDMICHQVLNHLSCAHKYTDTFLKDLLHQERSLVILDGLDEWVHPADTGCTNITPVPHRKARPKCTVLSTSRQWKMHDGKISKGKDNRHLEMLPLSENSVETLIRNVTARISNESARETDESFKEYIITNFLEEIASTPVILIQLVCLLFDGKLVGNSRCDIYCSIVDFMISRWEEKLQIKETSHLLTAQCNQEQLPDTPARLHAHDHCKKYYPLLLAVGKLAYTALFKYRKDSPLVIGSAVVDEILSKDQLECCLHLGFLTKNKADSLTCRQTTYSFIHKTFQEYFSAVYLQTFPISSCAADVVNVCNSVEIILEMSGVLIFLSNLSPESCNEIFSHLPEILSRDPLACSFRSRIHRFSADADAVMEDLQDMYVHCTINNKSVRPLIQDLIVDEYCSSGDYKNALITISKISEGCLKSLVFTDPAETHNMQDILHTFHLHQVHGLEQLHLCRDLEGQDIGSILSRSHKTLRCVSLGSFTSVEGKVCDKMVPLVGESIHTLSNMSQLAALDLCCLALSHSHLETLVSFITERTSLRQIFLAVVKCSDHGDSCLGFHLDVSKNQKITLLGLGFLPLSSVKYDTSCLEICYVGDLKSSNAFAEFLAKLPGAEHLSNIEFDEITCQSNLARMCDTICLLRKLRYLALTRINLGNRLLQLSADIGYIEEINMREVKFSLSTYLGILNYGLNDEGGFKYVFEDCGILAEGKDDEIDADFIIPELITTPIARYSETDVVNDKDNSMPVLMIQLKLI